MEKVYKALVSELNITLGMYYNPGVLKFGSSQHKDLILTYFAGVLVTLKITGQMELMEYIANKMAFAYENMETWIPDPAEFKVG